MKSSCMIAALALTLSATISAAAMRRIERVSVGENGIEAVSTSNTPAVSADGRFVAFTSFANNLVVGDTSPADVFLRDRLTGTTTRISVTRRLTGLPNAMELTMIAKWLRIMRRALKRHSFR